ncbi:MAG: hypothetical protein PVI86_12725 [Phycisphaerae bacterium]
MAGQYDRIVKPGQSGKIPVTVSTTRSGRLSKSISVHTNVPGKDGTVRLTIKGELWQPLDVKPRSANFGRLTPDAAQSPSSVKKLTIVNNMEGDANLTNVKSTNPAFQAETRVIEPGKKFELAVSVASPLPGGTTRGKVEMSTGIKEMPTLSVRVNAFVMSAVDVSPDRLFLPPQRSNDMKRMFTVRNNTKEPLKISELTSSDASVKVGLEELKPGKMFRINVDVPSGYHGSPSGDKITFKTDCPTAPEVTIPITESKSRRRARAAPARGSTRAHSRPRAAGNTQFPRVPAGDLSNVTNKPATAGKKPQETEPGGG